MAKAAKPVPYVREYHVYSDATSVGEMKVVKKDSGESVVRMSPAQAQYWIDQGAIGDKPKSELSPQAKAALDQFRNVKPNPPPIVPAAEE